MVKIYSTLGRKFNKKDLEEAQRMGQELVCCPNIFVENFYVWFRKMQTCMTINPLKGRGVIWLHLVVLLVVVDSTD